MLSEYFWMGAKYGFDLMTVQDVVFGFLAVLALAGTGFYFKGVWGAIGAVGIGLLGYLFWNQISLF